MNPETPRNPREILEARVTALLLGELSPGEAAELRAQIAADPALAALHTRLEQAVALLREAIAEPSVPAAPAQLSDERREALLAHFKTIHAPVAAPRRDWKWIGPMSVAAALVILIGGALTGVPAVKESGRKVAYNLVEAKLAKAEWDGGLSQNMDGDFIATDGGALAGERVAVAVEAKADSPTLNYRFGNAPAPATAAAKPLATNGPVASAGLDFGTQGRPAVTTENYYAFAQGGSEGKPALPLLPARADDFDAFLSGGLAGAAPGTEGKGLGSAGGFGANAAGANAAPASGPQTAASPAPADDHWFFKRGLTVAPSAAAPAEEKPVLFGESNRTVENRFRGGGGWAKFNGAASEGTFWDVPAADENGKNSSALGAIPGGGGLPGLAQTRSEDRFNESEARDRSAGVALQTEPAGEPTAAGRTINEFAADRNGVTWQSQSGAIRFDADANRPSAGDKLSGVETDLAKKLAMKEVNDAETLAKERKPESMLGRPTVEGLESIRGEPALQRLPAKPNEPANEAAPLAAPAPVTADAAKTAAPEESVVRELARRSVSNPRGRVNVEAGQPGQRALAERDTRTGVSQSESLGDLTSEDVTQLSIKPLPADGIVEMRTKLADGAGLEEATKMSVDKLAKLEDGLVRQQVNEPAEVDSPKPKAKAAAPVPQPEVLTSTNAFSTFSLNVTDVSFKLAAASLEKGVMPDPASMRSEEFINAFDYRDPEPAGAAPLTFATERARYPFAQNRDVLRLAVKTAAAGRAPGRALNLVLVIDNSGSMERADRVRILREALRVLAAQLQPADKLSVITFARTPRLWADGVTGDKAGETVARVGEITPEGGTNIAAALDLGYATARRHGGTGSINRVVLLTDGAANLGDVNPTTLQRQVEAQRRQGIALDCFGIGWEGFNDELLEQLSRRGDGRYGFINTPEEAASEFAAQLAGALRVAASDIKVQVEFNPRRVAAYRQIGYAKHQLTKEQFRDNTVDAAEIGAAESGNALYVLEVNPRGEGDLATVRVRFKVPGTAEYREHAWSVPFDKTAVPLEQASSALRLAATASAFSEMLAGSPYAAEVTSDALLGFINGVPAAFGADPRPQRLEWMIRQAKSLSGR